jgi:dTDP-4-dehydrorhamnose 3,5-epimerase
MKVEKTVLEGVVIITPDVFPDDRGYFFESFSEKRYQEALGADVRFVQDNFSFSKKGVLRGLHYQIPPHGQGKLVTVLRGKALDVAIDIRFGSPTFGKHVIVEISEENHRQVYIPEGFAHGCLLLEDDTLFMYKCTGYYDKNSERGVRWNDPALGIDWGVADPIVKERDARFPLFADIAKDYTYQS